MAFSEAQRAAAQASRDEQARKDEQRRRNAETDARGQAARSAAQDAAEAASVEREGARGAGR